MRRIAIILVLMLAGLAGAPAHAVQPDEIMPDPAKEARARDLSRELRCMVCQNQSIDDSDAPLARDLRVLVRERLSAGESDRQIIDFLVARYGEFVLLRPSWSARTALLWLAPLAALLLGAVALVVGARRGTGRSDATGPQAAPLSPEEQARLADVLQRSDR